jgi:hypothetical protein
LDLLTKVSGQQGHLVNELKAESTRMIKLAKYGLSLTPYIATNEMKVDHKSE